MLSLAYDRMICDQIPDEDLDEPGFDFGHPEPPCPTLESAEWIESQAAYYRSLGSNLGDLLAREIESLARDWRILSAGRPIGVEEFEDRRDIMREMDCELASTRDYL